METPHLEKFQDITNIQNGQQSLRKKKTCDKMLDKENITACIDVISGVASFKDGAPEDYNTPIDSSDVSEKSNNESILLFTNSTEAKIDPSELDDGGDGNKSVTPIYTSSNSSTSNIAVQEVGTNKSFSEHNTDLGEEIDDEFGIMMFHSQEELQKSIKDGADKHEVDSPVSEVKRKKKKKRSSWIQCDRPECQKWRRIDYVDDLQTVSDGKWICCMNEDSQYNDCDLSQESVPNNDTDDESVYTTYKPGTVVLGKMAGYPWWPAIIEDDPDFDSYFYLCRKKEKMVVSYHVTFLGKDVSRAWLTEVAITNFDGHETLKDLGTLSSGSKRYARQLSNALIDAKNAIEFSLEKRVRRYGFLRRYKGDVKSKDTNNQNNNVEKKRSNNDVKKEKHKTVEKKKSFQGQVKAEYDEGTQNGDATTSSAEKGKSYQGKQTTRKFNKNRFSKGNFKKETKKKKSNCRVQIDENLDTLVKSTAKLRGKNAEMVDSLQSPVIRDKSPSKCAGVGTHDQVGKLQEGYHNPKHAVELNTELTENEKHTENMIKKYISSDQLDKIILSKSVCVLERQKNSEAKAISRKADKKVIVSTNSKKKQAEPEGKKKMAFKSTVIKKTSSNEPPKNLFEGDLNKCSAPVDEDVAEEQSVSQSLSHNSEDILKTSPSAIEIRNTDVKRSATDYCEIVVENISKLHEVKNTKKPAKEKSKNLEKKTKNEKMKDGVSKKKSQDGKETKAKTNKNSGDDLTSAKSSAKFKKMKIPKLVKPTLPSVPTNENMKSDGSQGDKPPPKLKKLSFKAPVKADSQKKIAPSFSVPKKKTSGGKRPMTCTDELEIITEPPAKKIASEDYEISTASLVKRIPGEDNLFDAAMDLFSKMNDEKEDITQEDNILNDSPEF